MGVNKYVKGDVVLAALRNSLDGRTKVRPALVIQANEIRTDVPQLILCMITSKTNRVGDTRILVNNNSDLAKSMGLSLDSVIVVDFIVTIPEQLIFRKIGECSIMNAVDNALKLILGLK